MKRILSFILMLSLVLSCSLLAHADAGVAYDISYDAEEGVLVINNLQADQAGRIVLRFDSNVNVYANEGTVKKPKMVLATADNNENIWWDAGYSVAATYYAEDENYKYIGVDWYNAGNVNTSEDPDDYLFWITVDFDDETKLNQNSIVSAFDVSAVKGFLTEIEGIYGSTLATISPSVAMPVSLTYPNSDKSAGGDEPEDWKDTLSDETPGDVKFPASSDKIGTDDLTTDANVKKVVVFAKNTSANALVGTKDGPANYGITVGGTFYPGFLSVPAGKSWSIILVDPTGEKLTAGEYTVTATVDGVTNAMSNVSFAE